MDHTINASKSLSQIDVQSKIDDFFRRFKIATLMHQCGVRKHHGHSVRSLTKAIFTLPFVGAVTIQDLDTGGGSTETVGNIL